MKNSFNVDIPEIHDIFEEENVELHIRKTLRDVLSYLDVSNPEKVVEYTIQNAKTTKKLSEYERNVHRLFDQKRIIQGIPAKLEKRAGLIFRQIKDYIQGHQILDLGCGDGEVGELISKQGREVILADTYRNGNISNLDMPFVKVKQTSSLPFDENLFDSTLLVTVLHHSNNPDKLLSEVTRVTKPNGRVIVIESVYGVKKYGGGLTTEQQRRVNIFFDHFYNRVIHYSRFEENKVNVPFNFCTPNEWKVIFAKHGLKQHKVVHLGFDQPTVPEYHTLHVLEVRK